MEIKPISNNVNLVKNTVVKKQEEQKQDVAPKDRLEISAHAKFIKESGIDVKNLAEIRKKIDSGYYNSEEVLKKVTEKILKEISE